MTTVSQGGDPLNSPSQRAWAIKSSLRAFGWGLIALIPLVGFLPAIYALLLWLRNPRRIWNPARKYLDAAALMAVWSLLSTALLVAAIIIAAS